MAKKTFYLIARRDRTIKGKPVFYCRFRTPEGDLLPWKSTGETTKTRAELWALQRIKEGRIATPEGLSFGTFASDFWDWDGPYIKGRLSRGAEISRSYADAMNTYLNRHVLQHFKDKQLSAITGRTVEAWLFRLQDSGLSPTTANHCLSCLKLILKQAVRQGLLPSNPAANVERLALHQRQKTALSLGEAKKLLQEDQLTEHWSGDRKHYVLNLLAAATGARMSELQALRIRDVADEYIAITAAWKRKYGRGPTKTKWVREVPIPQMVAKQLRLLMDASPFREPEDLVFWGKDQAHPLDAKRISEALYSALGKIGICEEERRRRNISFHSWRYFLNSLLRARQIADPIVQRVTGHRSLTMTERYTRFNRAALAPVLAVQQEVFP